MLAIERKLENKHDDIEELLKYILCSLFTLFKSAQNQNKRTGKKKSFAENVTKSVGGRLLRSAE